MECQAYDDADDDDVDWAVLAIDHYSVVHADLDVERDSHNTAIQDHGEEAEEWEAGVDQPVHWDYTDAQLVIIDVVIPMVLVFPYHQHCPACTLLPRKHEIHPMKHV